MPALLGKNWEDDSTRRIKSGLMILGMGKDWKNNSTTLVCFFRMTAPCTTYMNREGEDDSTTCG
jgi:hypothetical protein